MIPGVRWRFVTPTHAPGALAVCELVSDSKNDLSIALGAVLGDAREVNTGESPLRAIAGVDTGVVARWTDTCCHLIVHGGPAVVRELGEALEARGLARATLDEADYSEARSNIELRMLRALARAASPAAVDVLLAQPRLWADAPLDAAPNERDRALRRLIDPPLVVALGATNVGKSSLLNALAGRLVAVVADEPGTTVDHVGVLVDLAGLVVRYIDTPGVRADAPAHEQAGLSMALDLARGADLVLLCGDATAPPPAWTAAGGQRVLRIGTRADLGPAAFEADLRVSLGDCSSIVALVRRARDELVPREWLAREERWVFWDEDGRV